MTRRRSKFYTLLVLDDAGRVRRLRLQASTLRAALAGLGVAGFLMALLLLVFVSDRFTIAGLERQLQGPEPVAAPQTTTAPEYETIDPTLLAQASERREAAQPVARYFSAAMSGEFDVPHRWPLRGWVTSEFGPRRNAVTGLGEMHRGIDIAATVGSEVRAPAAGTVLVAGEEPGFGEVIAIAHGQGIVTYHGHLDLAFVVVGQHVAAGRTIGRSGNTGVSTGPHLHYEVRRYGIAVDPRGYLPRLGQAPAAL